MDKLPEIYWYVFWIGLVLIAFGAAYMGGRAGHQRAMKALDILKMYAEKGAEPPQSVMDQLARQALEAGKPDPARSGSRAALIQGFIGFLFMACVAGGFVIWLPDSGLPAWPVAVANAAMAFFGFGSFGFLVLALLTRDK